MKDKSKFYLLTLLKTDNNPPKMVLVPVKMPKTFSKSNHRVEGYSIVNCTEIDEYNYKFWNELLNKESE